MSEGKILFGGVVTNVLFRFINEDDIELVTPRGDIFITSYKSLII